MLFSTGCKYNGQFLPNDYDECSYFRCDFGDEPWYDEYGNIQFVEVPMKCAGGSSTNHYKFDPQNPCGETSDKCGAPGRMLIQITLKHSSCTVFDNIDLSKLKHIACSVPKYLHIMYDMTV